MRGLSSRGRWLVRRNVVSLIQREPSNTRDPHTVTRTNSPDRKRSKALATYSPAPPPPPPTTTTTTTTSSIPWLLLREDARIGRIRLKVRGLEVMGVHGNGDESGSVYCVISTGAIGYLELQVPAPPGLWNYDQR
ncbi:hypothetical protein K0M31_005427 [Melipona bicolor]|uniref:Uncharacterized protein n=1 Tax=Melipona bicolor TaxID=60889 RepID=A0AA40FV19_9HYME|nr:hypothetical protein K0M31_005427 [Melipona bicolor]